MPEISRFLGIVIALYYEDHAPPHFHAKYGEYEITVEIQTGVVKGHFPRRGLAHVLEWHDLHREELHENGIWPERGVHCAGSRHWSESMFPRVIQAHRVRDYVVRLRFQDGIEGEADLESQLHGEIFEPLREPSYFRQFRVDPDLHTIVWPNGADFAPEFLYQRVQVTA